MKPRIVLSGVNFVEGGPLAVFHDALAAHAAHFLNEYEVVALVHRRELFQVAGITYIEFPEVKNSWLRRLSFEYLHCRRLSKTLKPFLWLAMHDITPNVESTVRAVYCHNPAPFYSLPLREALLDRSFTLFHLLYRALYAINIDQNDFVIVQQEWLRGEFRRLFPVRKVIVAHPSIPSTPLQESAAHRRMPGTGYVFIYPALARCFKNFELILESARTLEQQGIRNFEIRLTLAGSENRYAAELHDKFRDVRSVRWLGKQTRAHVEELYREADCLLFPSKLETWGMPISEWKRTGKPMLVADLPYAHETVGEYRAVSFINPSDVDGFASMMSRLIRGDASLSGSRALTITPPFARDWPELFEVLLRSRASGLSEKAAGEVAS